MSRLLGALDFKISLPYNVLGCEVVNTGIVSPSAPNNASSALSPTIDLITVSSEWKGLLRFVESLACWRMP